MSKKNSTINSETKSQPTLPGLGDEREIPPKNSITQKTNSTKWLGLITTHRRLFEASQTGWLCPLDDNVCELGLETYVSENTHAAPNTILIQLTFDSNKIPSWNSLATAETQKSTISWCSPIPLYATTKLQVASAESKNRLLAMTEQLANVTLPHLEITITESAILNDVRPDVIKGNNPKIIKLPDDLNAVHGAIAMAFWGVPRIPVLVDLLCSGVNQNKDTLTKYLTELNLPWFRFPWCRRYQNPPQNTEFYAQTCLWEAAIEVLKNPFANEKSGKDCANDIFSLATQDTQDSTLTEWLEQTQKLLNSEYEISDEKFKKMRPELAIQLVLLRPEPEKFKSWIRDLPGLSPIIWMAATILCGWRNGYRSLQNGFRSENQFLDEFSATRALLYSHKNSDSSKLSESQMAPLIAKKHHSGFSLVWNQDTIFQKNWTPRGRWYNVDLNNPKANKAAEEMANSLNWSFGYDVVFPEGTYQTTGTKSLKNKLSHIVIDHTLRIKLPLGQRLSHEINQQDFYQRLATEFGYVQDVPRDILKIKKSSNSEKRETRPDCINSVPGLSYRRDFISQQEENDIVEHIDSTAWDTQLKSRKVQQYGWRYDYGKREISKSERIGNLPDWLDKLAQKLVDLDLVNHKPNQVIINEYIGNQGITKHIDKQEQFGEFIATVSLLETWAMNFRRDKQKMEVPLHRRSAVIMSGDARYKWSHEIPRRKSVTVDGKIIERKRRISLTFRNALFNR